MSDAIPMIVLLARAPLRAVRRQVFSAIVLTLAQTIADLAVAERVTAPHMAEALLLLVDLLEAREAAEAAWPAPVVIEAYASPATSPSGWHRT